MRSIEYVMRVVPAGTTPPSKLAGDDPGKAITGNCVHPPLHHPESTIAVFLSKFLPVADVTEQLLELVRLDSHVQNLLDKQGKRQSVRLLFESMVVEKQLTLRRLLELEDGADRYDATLPREHDDPHHLRRVWSDDLAYHRCLGRGSGIARGAR